MAKGVRNLGSVGAGGNSGKDKGANGGTRKGGEMTEEGRRVGGGGARIEDEEAKVQYERSGREARGEESRRGD
jgi:hypothetical protein